MSEKCDTDSDKFDGFDINEIKDNYKALADEMMDGGQSATDLVSQQEKPIRNFRNYNPSILDFLARANTEDECKEIIDYMLSQGEIKEEEANHYMVILEKEGSSAFGTRLPGHYEREIDS